MARKQSKDLDLEFNVIKPKLVEIKNLYGLRERESQRKDHFDFEISRHRQGIEQRINDKKDTILAQEGVIKALAREVREHQSHFGGSKTKARDQLIEMASKELELDNLQLEKQNNLPEIELRKKALAELNTLRDEEQKLEMEVEGLQRSLAAFDRPRSALQDSLAQINDTSKQQWLNEREQKMLELRQVESKIFNKQREMKHRAKQHASEVASLKF